MNKTRLQNRDLLHNRQTERKLTGLVLMVFVPIAAPCAKQWSDFTTFVFVKEFGRLSRKSIVNGVVERERERERERELDELR